MVPCFHRRVVLCVPGVLMLCIVGCAPTGSFKVTALPADLSLKERLVITESIWESNRIALIEVSGILMNSHQMGLFSEGEHPVSFLVEKLQAAAKDDRVKAIVLRINSPGGSVTASDTMYEELLAFRKKTGKPVIAYFQDVSASGAYYLSCAADEIIAQRTSVTGSIGVIMQMMDVSGTLGKIGVVTDAITSGAFKDAGSPLRKMKPEERKVFQDLVDGFYNQFVDIVAAGRPKLTREQIVKLADGRVYNAQQALEAGLIDRIGTLDDALTAAKTRANIKRANVVVYHRPLDWTPNIYARGGPESPANVNVFNFQLPSLFTGGPRFMYIWRVEG
ncbi:MAG: signal peptide peptidase SppA [Phycisphaerae bacterium]|nr:MAG: signal peptide peptidase SppA [Planctomycetia bacterium]RIK68385.1 MAG: signal peptide peptidase SppA [Planctomycetota bacterium]GJQ26046.1 MAG: signal peptide peptidase SppA [Phycisphaerae bacterium]